MMAVPAMTLSSVCLFLVFHEETLPDCDRVNEALSSVCPAAFLSQSSGSATLFGVRDDPDTIDFLVRCAQAILSSVDSDGDGEISFAEFRRLWGRGLDEFCTAQARQAFDRIDTDGSGVVSRARLLCLWSLCRGSLGGFLGVLAFLARFALLAFLEAWFCVETELRFVLMAGARWLLLAG